MSLKTIKEMEFKWIFHLEVEMSSFK
jgi:hypothetical protein